MLYVCCSGMCCAVVCFDMYNYQYIVMYTWVVCYCDVHVSFTSFVISYTFVVVNCRRAATVTGQKMRERMW